MLPRGTLRRILEVQLPSEPYRYPRLPQAAKTLGASGGRHSDEEQLKANSGNDYQEMVTGKIAVPNPFEKAPKLYPTLQGKTLAKPLEQDSNIF